MPDSETVMVPLAQLRSPSNQDRRLHDDVVTKLQVTT